MERWTGTPEGTCNVLRMFRETHAISARSSSTTRMWAKASRGDDGSQFRRKRSGRPCKILHSAKDLGVGIGNDIEWLIYKTIQYKLYAVLNINSKLNKPLRDVSRLTPLHPTPNTPLNAPRKLSYMIISPYVFIWQNLFYCTKKSPHLWGFCLI